MCRKSHRTELGFSTGVHAKAFGYDSHGDGPVVSCKAGGDEQQGGVPSFVEMLGGEDGEEGGEIERT